MSGRGRGIRSKGPEVSSKDQDSSEFSSDEDEEVSRENVALRGQPRLPRGGLSSRGRGRQSAAVATKPATGDSDSEFSLSPDRTAGRDVDVDDSVVALLGEEVADILTTKDEDSTEPQIKVAESKEEELEEKKTALETAIPDQTGDKERLSAMPDQAEDKESLFENSSKEYMLRSDYLPPQSRLTGLFPGKPTVGRKCKLQTNHFAVSLKFPEGMIYMYDVTIVPPWNRDYRRQDKQLYHDVIKEWKEACPAAKANTSAWVFDGHKSLFSTKLFRIEELPDQKVTVWSQEEERYLDVIVKDVQRVNDIRVTKDIVEWAMKGRSGMIPQDALQALDIVLKEAVNLDLNFYNIGRSYFPMDGQTIDVGFGKEVWCGSFSAVRPYGWKDHEILLTLNVDTAHKPATRNLFLVKESAPGKCDSYVHYVLTGDGRRKVVLNFNRGLTDEQVQTLRSDIKDLKVKYELPKEDGVHKRHYRINGLRNTASKEIIPDLGISVEKYFKETYKVDLKYPNLPCLWVGSRMKTICVPMEFCRMDRQPMPKSKKLQDDAVAKMIRQTAMKPVDRQKKIIENLMKSNNMYKTDPYAKEFGINVAGEMATLTGRVLDAPVIEYADKKESSINKATPGKWFQGKNQYVVGGMVSNWCVLDFAMLTDGNFQEIVQNFASVGKESGLKFNSSKTEVLRLKGSSKDAEFAPGVMEDLFKKIVGHFEEKGKSLQLVLVVFPFKAGFLYDKIKQLADKKFGIVTQCCLKGTLWKKGDSIDKLVVANICLKINSKLGGINHVLSAKSKPAILKRPVMVMGADVSHPAPESRGSKPSIAAIVASNEPKAANYEVEVRIQSGAQNEEVIQDMKNVTKSLLLKFFASNKGRKPEKIIMFRDGVSEGQFLTVLAKELIDIRSACNELEDGYQPQITYIVVQKRHHTRFFPTDSNKYKNGNALAGTVVDQGINHPTEGDYYLLSHEGIQGTSRPCHYQVLWDDSEFSADELEVLSYYLCHLYARCSRAVSYPTPTYYAHLVADRARKHHNELAGALLGSTSGSGGCDLSDNDQRRVKDLVETPVLKTMYFV